MLQKLKPTKQKVFKGKIFGFDIETCNDNKELVCATIYYDDNNFWTFTDKDELIFFLKRKMFWNSIIVATNLAFDFFGIFHEKKEVQIFDEE